MESSRKADNEGQWTDREAAGENTQHNNEKKKMLVDQMRNNEVQELEKATEDNVDHWTDSESDGEDIDEETTSRPNNEDDNEEEKGLIEELKMELAELLQMTMELERRREEDAQKWEKLVAQGMSEERNGEELKREIEEAEQTMESLMKQINAERRSEELKREREEEPTLEKQVVKKNDMDRRLEELERETKDVARRYEELRRRRERVDQTLEMLMKQRMDLEEFKRGNEEHKQRLYDVERMLTELWKSKVIERQS